MKTPFLFSVPMFKTSLPTWEHCSLSDFLLEWSRLLLSVCILIFRWEESVKSSWNWFCDKHQCLTNVVVLFHWRGKVVLFCFCFCFCFDVEIAFHCCCFSTAFHIATATWLVLWSQNSLKGHTEPVTILSVLGLSDVRMPLCHLEVNKMRLWVYRKSACEVGSTASLAGGRTMHVWRNTAWDLCVFASRKLQSSLGF